MDNEQYYQDQKEIEVDGILATGKQFDLDIILPEDDREVIYGTVKDRHGRPIEDAVVKLVEVIRMHGREFRAPISHTFTDKEGDFTFGPLCPNRKYEIIIWANDVKHKKMCVRPEKDVDCLKGVLMPKCDLKDDKPDKDEKEEDKEEK
ncbi:MAG: carboxypeptidase regulatory-like domain-containing protein [Clostridia bacterium]|nr:carboxypeptidase regulatory-like domain-containing protein [Clostridia bacterium]